MDDKYVGYDYKEVAVDSEHASFYLDGYQSFGWKEDENRTFIAKTGKTVLHLKRKRKIINKAELTRLERQFEDCLRQLDSMEKSKTTKATVMAISIGIIGTMFMAISTFAATAKPPIIWLCVIMAIPGFIGWGLPYFVYKAVYKKRQDVVTLLIEDKYDEVYAVCEKGYNLIN